MKKDGLKIRDCKCSDDCEMCVKGKMSRKTFPKKSTPVENVFDVVVSDVFGPMNIETVDHKKGFMTLDVHSGYTEVKFSRKKSEVAVNVINYVKKLKTQFGKKPKVFRSDRGGEYLCEKLQECFRNEGIIFQCTDGYTPEQNVKAERKNRTLMEAARSMLTESSLPQMFWAEAIGTANYIFNRISGAKACSPYEMIYDKKSTITEFHEFGCDAYVMIPYEKRKKLDDKAKRVKFLGYDEMSKGFRMVDENYKVIVSREVHFLDTKTPLKRSKIHQTTGFCFDFIDYETQHEQVQGGEVDETQNEDFDFQQTVNDVDENLEEDHQTETVNSSKSRKNENKEIEQRRVYPKRVRKPVDHSCYQAEIDDKLEPKLLKEALDLPDSEKWKNAMQEELDAINENEPWELVDLPLGRKAVGSKYVFKLKRDEQENIIRYKARLVAQGFSQKYGVDYDEVFAPVTTSTTMRMLLSIAGVRGYFVRNYDVKTAFYNGKLEEEIYMKKPPGFEVGNKVYRLKKSLYGLKQAARVWNQTLHRPLIPSFFRGFSPRKQQTLVTLPRVGKTPGFEKYFSKVQKTFSFKQ
jgi:Reverse transcriptase (RNA-dependent DNA polymerase)